MEYRDETEMNATTVLRVKDGFPQENNYVLECISSVVAARYNWIFGDGEKLIGVENRDVWHTYVSGNYIAQCIAYNDTATAQSSRTIDVTSATAAPTPVVSVAPWYPQGLHVVLRCDAPLPHVWEFGDGARLRLWRSDVYHVFPSAGTYAVTCSSGGASGSLAVTV
jgi:PKD repeat protein